MNKFSVTRYLNFLRCCDYHNCKNRHVDENDNNNETYNWFMERIYSTPLNVASFRCSLVLHAPEARVKLRAGNEAESARTTQFFLSLVPLGAPSFFLSLAHSDSGQGPPSNSRSLCAQAAVRFKRRKSAGCVRGDNLYQIAIFHSRM